MSSSKNPYRDGSNYFKLFDFILKPTKFTRGELVEFARDKLKMGETSAEASVTVVMSPRSESTRGDCRGNISAAGHLYYIEKMGRKADKDGVKAEQEYKLRWRSTELEPKTRKSVKQDKAGKTIKSTVASKSAKSAKKAAKKATKKITKAGVKKKVAQKIKKGEPVTA